MSEECADCREGLPEGLDGLYDLAFREMAIVKGKCDRGEVSWNSLPESEQHQVDGFSAMFLEAAEQGHTEAQGHVASMYEDGSGLRKDEALAFEMYTKLALQDEEDVVTQFSLGRMYHDGRGCDQSYELAFEWHTKAALQGYDHSQYCLALLYKYGKGCDQSSEQAFEWCAKAALQGDPWSQYTIADLYHTGDGCDQVGATSPMRRRSSGGAKQLIRGVRWSLTQSITSSDVPTKRVGVSNETMLARSINSSSAWLEGTFSLPATWQVVT